MVDNPVRVQSLVLAGGASTRMGIDKALISYHGEPQVRRLAAMMESVAGPAYVSVRRSQLDDPVFQGLRLLCDQVENIGPLAGLLAAFAQETSCAWLVAAVDLPWISAGTLQRLLSARDPACFATAYRIPHTERPEPVCAIYEPAILPALERAREKRRYSLMLLRDVPLKLLDAADGRELQGVNEPGEFRGE
ncbi:MAG TPA: NTP transferase domain-containing protein [Spirochaetia bacterium]|nr:NTP transferase domain-containing protein [Spirochaetia bacterium]